MTALTIFLTATSICMTSPTESPSTAYPDFNDLDTFSQKRIFLHSVPWSAMAFSSKTGDFAEEVRRIQTQ